MRFTFANRGRATNSWYKPLVAEVELYLLSDTIPLHLTKTVRFTRNYKSPDKNKAASILSHSLMNTDIITQSHQLLGIGVCVPIRHYLGGHTQVKNFVGWLKPHNITQEAYFRCSRMSIEMRQIRWTICLAHKLFEIATHWWSFTRSAIT